jgi:WD40 repeat protein
MSFRSRAQRTSEGISPPARSKGTTPKHDFTGHEKPIWDFVFLHDNVHVVSCSEDGTMRKWNCDTGLLVGEPWKGKGGSIYVLALSPDGKTIACGRGDGSVQRWDTNGGLIEPIWTRHSNWVRALSWSPSGNHLASGSDDGRIQIRKAESGKLGARPIKTKQGWVLALAYSPTGDRIASGGHNKTICIWDSKTGQCLVGPIEELGSRVDSVVWSPDGSKFYSASDKFARVFESVSGTLLHRFEHNDPLWSIALSPNRNILACVGRSGIVQLWDTESHQSLGQQETSHGKDLRYFASFSQNGRYLAYGGEDQKITLWKVDDIAPQLALTTSTTLPSSSGALEEKRQHVTESESYYLDVSTLTLDFFPGLTHHHR